MGIEIPRIPGTTKVSSIFPNGFQKKNLYKNSFLFTFPLCVPGMVRWVQLFVVHPFINSRIYIRKMKKKNN
jgi:hypothetical protein